VSVVVIIECCFKMNAKNIGAALFGSVALLVVPACGTNEQDPNHRVALYRYGQLESELRRDVGPPTQERTIDPKDPDALCRRLAGAPASPDRELIYEVPSRGLEKQVRDRFGMAPSLTYTVCVDRTGRILDVLWSEVH
jgi:hypothetical protein